MIRGKVSDELEPLVSIRVENASGHMRVVRALVDTGFNGWLSLPIDIIDELDLPWLRTGRAFLADDQEVRFSIFGGFVAWDETLREVSIDAGGATPLVGMGLLEDYELKVVARPGGEVSAVAIT
jgi:clan AA aspartic protease